MEDPILSQVQFISTQVQRIEEGNAALRQQVSVIAADLGSLPEIVSRVSAVESQDRELNFRLQAVEEKMSQRQKDWDTARASVIHTLANTALLALAIGVIYLINANFSALRSLDIPSDPLLDKSDR